MIMKIPDYSHMEEIHTDDEQMYNLIEIQSEMIDHTQYLSDIEDGSIDGSIDDSIDGTD